MPRHGAWWCREILGKEEANTHCSDGGWPTDGSDFFSHGAKTPSEAWHPNCRDFTITFNGHTTLGRTLLDEWSAPRIDLYLTTHNTHKRQASMPPAGLQPELPASERPQTQALERAATGIGWRKCVRMKNWSTYWVVPQAFVKNCLQQYFSVCR